MTICPRAPLAMAASIAFVLECPASANVTQFTHFDEWQSAAGSYSTIDFTGLPDGTFVSSQYAAQGVLFTDGNDIIRFGAAAFPIDEWGLDGNFAIHLSFLTPQSRIAVHFPGVVQFQLFSFGQLFFTSDQISNGGAVSGFAGLVSTRQFDSAILLPGGAPQIGIDNLYFGVPAPATLCLLALAGILPQRRRRR